VSIGKEFFGIFFSKRIRPKGIQEPDRLFFVCLCGKILEFLEVVVYIIFGERVLHTRVQALPADQQNFRKRVWVVIWMVWYHLFNRLWKLPIRCMNWGYLPDSDISLPGVSQETNQLLMYHKAIERSREFHKGTKILEVGCGRGGGLAYLSRVFPWEEAIGLDFCQAGLDVAKETDWEERYKEVPGKAKELQWLHGSCDEIPLGDGSVDTILNIESSHCYPKMSAFLADAARVLSKDGVFVLADYRSLERLPLLRQDLEQYFEILSEEDMTPCVINSMQKDMIWKQKLIQTNRKWAPRFLVRLFEHFSAGDTNAETYQRFVTGKFRYMRYVGRKRESIEKAQSSRSH